MSRRHDHDSEMRPNEALDEREIEAVLRGRVPAERPDLELLARFVDAARADLTASVPAPTRELASLLATGLPAGSRAGRARHRSSAVPRRRRARVAGLGLGAKVVMASLVTFVGMTGAGAAGALPGPLQTAFANSVDTVTPFTVPSPGSTGGPGTGPGDKDGVTRQDSDKKQGPAGDERTSPTPGPTARGNGKDHRGEADPHAPGAVPGGMPGSPSRKSLPPGQAKHGRGGPHDNRRPAPTPTPTATSTQR